MTHTPQRHPITLERFLHRVPGMEAVTVTRDVEYGSAGSDTLRMDIYSPEPAGSPVRCPAVVLASGYRDVGVPLPLGCVFKDMALSASWGQLVAASGMVAVTYTTREPAADLIRVLDFLAAGTTPGIDAGRLGIWAMSGHGPVALAALMSTRRPRLRAAILSQAFTMDIGGTAVAASARSYGFADACAGRSIDDLPGDVPIFVARAGRDEFPGLNDALDRFVAAAVAKNIPLTLVNHHTAAHAFELRDDSVMASALVDQMLAFMHRHLTR